MIEADYSTSKEQGGQCDGTPVYGASVYSSGADVDRLCVWPSGPAAPPAATPLPSLFRRDAHGPVARPESGISPPPYVPFRPVPVCLAQ
jgi:hypothetical protein